MGPPLAMRRRAAYRFAIQSRTYPTSTHTTSELGTRGYIGWHRDFEGPGIGISVNPSAVIKVSQPAERPRMAIESSIHSRSGNKQPASPIHRAQVFTYFEDVGEEDGCTTLVPGSNALTFDPRHAFR